MELGLGIKLIGWVFLITTAIGFLIESAPLFLVGIVGIFAWIGFVLRPSNR